MAAQQPRQRANEKQDTSRVIKLVLYADAEHQAQSYLPPPGASPGEDKLGEVGTGILASSV